jgi:hypothetical protein
MTFLSTGDCLFLVKSSVKLAILGMMLVCAVSVSAQKLTANIVNRQDNETDYTYVVPYADIGIRHEMPTLRICRLDWFSSAIAGAS